MTKQKLFRARFYYMFMTLAAVPVLAWCAFAIPNCFSIPVDVLHEGDIIFQTSNSSQSVAIQLATHSQYSHMGILLRNRGMWFVYEAVGVVKCTPLKQWIARGQGRRYSVKRLQRETLLTQREINRLKTVGNKFRSKPYDPYFEWSDDRIYCSELVWKIYKQALGEEIGHLQRLGTFDLKSPVVLSKLLERYGKVLPLNERVIAPSTMFESCKLVAVCAN